MEDDVNLKLIECFRTRPELWHPQLIDKSMNTQLWMGIAEEMGMKCEECKHKFHLLRVRYKREVLKIKQGEVLGTAYEPTWVAFKSLKFLAGEYCRRKTKENKENGLESIKSLKKKLDCLKLIRSYKARTLFWDRDDPKHDDRGEIAAAWEEVSKKMGLTSQECRNKMSKLNQRLRRERSKMKNGENFVSQWFPFKSLSFLDDNHKVPRIKIPKKKIPVPKMKRKKKISKESFYEDETTTEEDSMSSSDISNSSDDDEEGMRNDFRVPSQEDDEDDSLLINENQDEKKAEPIQNYIFSSESNSYVRVNPFQAPPASNQNKNLNFAYQNVGENQTLNFVQETVIRNKRSSRENEAERESFAQENVVEQQTENFNRETEALRDQSFSRESEAERESFAEESVVEQQTENFDPETEALRDQSFSRESEAERESFVQESVAEKQTENFYPETILRNNSFSSESEAENENNNCSPPPQIVNSPGEDAQCQSFGLFIGNKLKMYPSSTRYMVMAALNNVIFSADEGYLEPQQYHVTKYKLHK